MPGQLEFRDLDFTALYRWLRQSVTHHDLDPRAFHMVVAMARYAGQACRKDGRWYIVIRSSVQDLEDITRTAMKKPKAGKTSLRAARASMLEVLGGAEIAPSPKAPRVWSVPIPDDCCSGPGGAEIVPVRCQDSVGLGVVPENGVGTDSERTLHDGPAPSLEGSSTTYCPNSVVPTYGGPTPEIPPPPPGGGHVDDERSGASAPVDRFALDPETQVAFDAMPDFETAIVDAWSVIARHAVSPGERGNLRAQLRQVLAAKLRLHCDPEVAEVVNSEIAAVGTPMQRLEFMRDRIVAFTQSDRVKRGYVPAFGRWLMGRHQSGDGTPGWLADPASWSDMEKPDSGDDGLLDLERELEAMDTNSKEKA